MRMRYELELAETKIAVHAGRPILAVRMDEASPASFAMAIEKARSAALTGMPTQRLEALVKERPGVATMKDCVAIEGGLPVLHEGQRVGGIGVSGVQSHQDAEIAQTALQALMDQITAA